MRNRADGGRRRLCRALLACAVAGLGGVLPRRGDAQASDEERRRMEREGDRRLEERRERRDERREERQERLDAERERLERRREDWIKQPPPEPFPPDSRPGRRR